MKKLSFLLAIILLLSACLMTACKENKPESTTPESTTPEETTPKQDTPVVQASISPEQLTKYEIIYARESSQEVKDEVKKLVNAIYNSFGVILNKRTDLYYEGVESLKKGQYEILIGHTNREESDVFLAELRWDDYGHGMIGDKLVITGKNEDETFRVLRNFIELVQNANGDKTVFYDNANSGITTFDYAFPGLAVNGIPVSKLSILCNEQELGGVVQILRDAIIETSGIALPIVTDAEASDLKNAIVIGNTAHIDTASVTDLVNGEYYVDTTFCCLQLLASSAQDYYSAASELAMQLSGKGGENVVFTPGKRACSDAITVMSFNIMAGAQNGDARVDRVIKTVLKYRPAVIGVQEATDSWMNILREKLGDIYTIVGVGRNAEGHDEHSAILYLTEEFDCLESGTKWLSDTPDVMGSKFADSHYTRIMTYAHLSRKSDGMVFLYVNTHLDYGSTDTEEAVKVEQMQVIFDQIAKFGNIPTIITGDFNATVSSPVYGSIGAAGYLSAEAASQTDRYANTYHALMGTTGEPSHIDYILHTIAFSSIYYRVCRERIDNVSDHYPIYAVLTWNGK